MYTIKNENTGMYMDVPGSSTSNGTKIIQHQYNGGHENQQWILIKHENGYYSIKNVNSNLNKNYTFSYKVVLDDNTKQATMERGK